MLDAHLSGDRIAASVSFVREKRAVTMTQQHDELKPGAKQEAGQKLFDGRESVDLIELGLREDIDWEAEGQRVLKMLNEPMGQQLSKPTRAA